MSSEEDIRDDPSSATRGESEEMAVAPADIDKATGDLLAKDFARCTSSSEIEGDKDFGIRLFVVMTWQATTKANQRRRMQVMFSINE